MGAALQCNLLDCRLTYLNFLRLHQSLLINLSLLYPFSIFDVRGFAVHLLGLQIDPTKSSHQLPCITLDPLWHSACG